MKLNLSKILIKDRRKVANLLKKKDFEKANEVYQKSIQIINEKKFLKRNLNFSYDSNLPIVFKKQDISQTIKKNQVIVIAGDTGSGKTTQIPKICLEIGRGIYGKIAHTQPRRIATKATFSRLNEELKSSNNDAVGFQVRFESKTQDSNLINVLTDGTLLAQIQQDKFLNQYDTIIIDEAHERSLNIDFLLGFLKNLLLRRKDLKLIVTSATIDLERFSQFFDNAPIIKVSGKIYPIEIIYQEPIKNDDHNILKAIQTLFLYEKNNQKLPGDILIFLTGERDIKELLKILEKENLPSTTIIPLYARLVTTKQNKLFNKIIGRKIVLATNIAETSLTIPGIRYVIDTGFARISRYSVSSKMQRLPIEPISKASANQRAGRCGRVEPGICIRLYSKDDFESRSEFNDPEILRTNLSSIILQMLYLKLGDIESFPFLERPNPSAINDGKLLLKELNAIDSDNRLTQIGTQIAKLPIDPKLARIIIAGDFYNCLNEILIIVSYLSVSDVRISSIDNREKAKAAFKQFVDEKSDFISIIHLWNLFNEKKDELTKKELKNWCEKNYLSYLRILDWSLMYNQLFFLAKEIYNINSIQDLDYKSIHLSLLTGFLLNIGSFNKEDNNFIGARGHKFIIHPSSSLIKKKPKYLVCANLIELEKKFAAMVAVVEAEWIISVSEHLLKKQYFEPHWEKNAGFVSAFCNISLYGVLLSSKTKVHFGDIDPKVSREIFIKEALVLNQIKSNAKFLAINSSRINETESLEAKTRRLDVTLTEEDLYNFYEKQLPLNIYQTSTFNKWYKRESFKNTNILILDEKDLIKRNISDIDSYNYPDFIKINGLNFPLEYCFDPGNINDGVSLTVNQVLLNQIDIKRIQWLIPAFLKEKCFEILRNLPKDIRKRLVPVPDTVDDLMEKLEFGEGDLLRQISDILNIDCKDLSDSDSKLPDYLKMNIIVIDDSNKVLAVSRDIALLIKQYSVNKSLDKNIVENNFIINSFEKNKIVSGIQTIVYQALNFDNNKLFLEEYTDKDQAFEIHQNTIVSLLLKKSSIQTKYLMNNFIKHKGFILLTQNLGGAKKVSLDVFENVMRNILAYKVISTSDELDAFAKENLGFFVAKCENLHKVVLEIIHLYNKILTQLKILKNENSEKDINNQLKYLIYDGFVKDIGFEFLIQYPRYLNAILMRIEKLKLNSKSENEQLIYDLIDLYDKCFSYHNKSNKNWKFYRFMLEEYRVSLFAQKLGTKWAASLRRLEKQWLSINS